MSAEDMDRIERRMADQETRLTRQMNIGFKGTHTRLDRLNGKTDRHGEQLVSHEVRLTSVEARPGAAAPADSAIARPLTRWDATVFGLGVGVIWGVVRLIEVLR